MNTHLNQKKAYRIFNVFLLTCMSLYANGQMETKGKEFWGTVNTTLSPPDSVTIFVSTEKACTVSLKIFSTSRTTTVSISKNTLYRFTIKLTEVAASKSWHIQNRGFMIQSSEDISAYLLVATPHTTDATVLLPSIAIPLKSEYLLLSFYSPKWRYESNSIIVSHDDNTIIQFNLKDTTGHPAKDTIIMDTLGKGDCFQVTDIGSHSFSGGTVKVLNNKKISAFCGHACVNISCGNCDMLLEQAPPISTLGKLFLIPPFYGHTNGYVILVTTDTDNTIVYRDGTAVDTLAQGEVYQYNVNSEIAICIETSNPVLMAQLMKGYKCNGSPLTGDPSLVYISPNGQLIQSALVATTNTVIISKHFINLVLPKRGIDSMYIDDSLVPRSKLTVSNCGDFYWFNDTLTPGDHQLFNHYGFLAYIYGTGTRESYAYTAGSGLRNLEVEISYISHPLCDSGRVFIFEPSDTTLNYYTWIWDDGSPPDTNITAVHRYYDHEEHLVKLAYRSKSNGPVDTIYQYISYQGNEKLDLITKKNTNACTDSSYKLEAIAIPSYSYQWSTGDSTSTISIDTSGTYTLMATDSITGCVTYDTIDVLFYKDIKANFTFSPPLLCGGSDIEMRETSTVDTATDSLVHFYWYVDYVYQQDNTSDTLFIAKPNNYDIELRIESLHGCRDSITKRIVVSDTPNIEAIIHIKDKCLTNSRVHFSNISTTSFGTIDSTYWVFSNGDTVLQKEFDRSFVSAGNKWVDLYAKTKQGCTNTKRYYFRIEPSPDPGIAVINADPCFNNNLFTFKSNDTSSTPSTYLWYWGDGTSTASLTPLSNHKSYKDTGVYNIELIVAHFSSGCSDTSYITIKVIDQNPKASLNQDSSDYCLEGNYIRLSDTSTVPASQTYTRRWEWGDTSTYSTDSSLSLSFDTTGVYNINLIIETDKGCLDTASKKFSVFPTNFANFKIIESFNCESGNFFTLKNLNPLKDTRYRWEHGDGQISNRLVDSVTMSYANSGSYKVLLRTETYLYSCVDTFTKTIQVYPKVLADMALKDTSSCISNNSFTTTDITDYKGSPINNNWYIDGILQARDTNSISKHFDNIGNKTIQLIAGSSSTCPDTTAKVISIIDRLKADIVINKNNQCLSNNMFNFSIIKMSPHDSITSYTWNLDDDKKEITRKTNAVYTLYGSKNISVTVKTKLGCIDTLQAIVRVYPQLNPQIVINDTNQCLLENQYVFSYAPFYEKDSISTIIWKLGETRLDSKFSPDTISYLEIGKKTITVNVTSVNGCKDSTNLDIEVFPITTSKITGDTVCLTEECFIQSKIDSENSISKIEWLLEGEHYYGPSLKTVMTDTGAYDVQLIVTTEHNCTDTILQEKALLVNESPVADFYYKVNQLIRGKLSIEFKTASSSDVVYHSWTFPEGQQSNDMNPTKEFTQSDLLPILLYVENAANCSDTTMKMIDFISKVDILIPSAFSPNGDGLNDLFGPSFIERHKAYILKIYNRWGELLFYTTSTTDFWDGTYQDKPCQPGTYIYTIKYNTALKKNISFKGPVTLLK